MKYLLLLLSLSFIGCSSHYHKVQPLVSPINSPPLNEVKRANIGENILAQATHHIFDAIHLRKDLTRNFGCHNASAGWYIRTSTDDDFDYYAPAPKSHNGGRIYVGNGLCLGWVDALKREKGSGDLCLRNSSIRDLCDDDEDFSLTTLDLVHLNSVQKSLVYNGLIGNKVNFAYREFSGNLNHTRYSNNVEYDLSESTIIGYQSAKIEIIEATNRYLTYRVLKHLE